MRPTMHDVARAAGVSVKTVSRVVNQEPGVRPATSVRVERAVEALGFRRNDVARNLRTSASTATVGLVIEDLANPFYSSLAGAVERVARQHGHMVLVGSSEEDPGRERELVGELLRRRVDGLVIVPAGQDHQHLARELELGVPMVFADRPPGGLAADAVLIDDEGGARLAVAHLARRGHRRIAIVGDPPSVFTAGRRLSGYRAALAAHGLPRDVGLLRLGSRDVAGAATAARELLSGPAPPTAIFATNNRSCIGALRAVHELGRRVAVVGFDDFEVADMLPLPASVVAHDPREMGRLAAELLFARLAGDRRPPRRITLPVRLVERGSGELGP